MCGACVGWPRESVDATSRPKHRRTDSTAATMTPQELLAVLPRNSVLRPSLPGLPAEPDAETLAAVALAEETAPTQGTSPGLSGCVPRRRPARAVLRVRRHLRHRQDDGRDAADAGVCGVGGVQGAGVVLPALMDVGSMCAGGCGWFVVPVQCT
ncbi:hypothetical protein DFJ74DRAFT_443897 [Hyaloraphidium curvatum]|nr:hypothetical protein DFJ74DRAFT_443897 [Hyaloraphidium curvatum]